MIDPIDQNESETYSNSPLGERPTFNDIRDGAKQNLVQRAVSAYLFSKNPERSEKIYKYLGMPLVRTAIMGTYGKLLPRSSLSNYRTDASKTRIEGSMRFAVGGSVFNEALHTIGMGLSAGNIAASMAEHDNPTSHIVAFAINTALVGLQRYNRARMQQRVDQELAAGKTFDPDYRNWLGIDGRAAQQNEDVYDKIDKSELVVDSIHETNEETLAKLEGLISEG